ncbi:MAG: penicillin-binding protein 1C [Patescibacteria group bacterium]
MVTGYLTITVLWNLPEIDNLSLRNYPQTTKILDRNGKLLYQIYVDQNRTVVPLEKMPKALIQATLAIEDKNFYSHPGISLIDMGKALTRWAFTGYLQGGSTITQQLVKNTLLNPERTWQRKVKEVVLALMLESKYSKNEILEMYLNLMPYGGTAWGVEAASETYFGKNVSALTLSESAFLAGLPQSPTTYSPFGTHPELAKIRQQNVLQNMKDIGAITVEQYNEALKEEIKILSQKTEIKAPHFVFYVKDLLAKQYGLKIVEQGGLQVTTTLDLDIQEKAETIAAAEIAKVKNLQVGNAAVLITNPQTGEILAMVGSIDYFDAKNDGNVNVVLAKRQPGSAIKPVNYVAAFEEKLFSPWSVIDDSPVAYKIPDQPVYTPQNYDGRFHGRVTIRTALASSFNVPAVKVLEKVTVSKMIAMGKKLGITTWGEKSRFGLSLTLGGGEVTMLDMATVYATFANQGRKVTTMAVKKVVFPGNAADNSPVPDKGEQVLSSKNAFLISSILADNNARSLAFGWNSQLVIPGHTVSVKTGTTDSKKDNWTVGYTPTVLVAVWVGNNNGAPMHPYLTSGVTGAAPIWNLVMKEMLKNKQDEPLIPPENMVKVAVCSFNGLLPCEFCPTVEEYFPQDKVPTTHCTISPTPTPTPP